ncbi:hypothetical protein BCR33DRAFT_717884 [Rhizoclosmatium globosum]|uniref:HMG box domain-containing protein n=1 Tax=Rhizoclosmatium globosum TaxID=329046 RepID=A0A1Y2C7Z0_9FUNG|nr:hypothetical protein BCR33DRAFT_717884 [Rhizoclosmatium globosum]|eukprot:ORY43150.1 hypothetical protein BCR33DRAFT_717884 [Rhizoclosmatium globosum]
MNQRQAKRQAPNAFMVYRSEMLPELSRQRSFTSNELSAEVARLWNEESDVVRAKCFQKSRMLQHQLEMQQSGSGAADGRSYKAPVHKGIQRKRPSVDFVHKGPVQIHAKLPRHIADSSTSSASAVQVILPPLLRYSPPVHMPIVKLPSVAPLSPTVPVPNTINANIPLYITSNAQNVSNVSGPVGPPCMPTVSEFSFTSEYTFVNQNRTYGQPAGSQTSFSYNSLPIPRNEPRQEWKDLSIIHEPSPPLSEDSHRSSGLQPSFERDLPPSLPPIGSLLRALEQKHLFL